MFPESNWLNALRLPLRATLGIFIGCVVLLALEQYALIDTSALGTVYAASVTVVAVVSGALSLTGIVGVAYDLIVELRKPSLLAERRNLRKVEHAERRKEFEESALARIDYLSANELRYLADALRSNSQSFYTYVHSPPIATLMEKGLAQTFGGTYHQDHYPFTIPDYVWRHLMERKDEILKTDDANRAAEKERERQARSRRH